MEHLPVIGIVPTQLPDEGVLRINDHYVQAVVAAGAAPLVLPLSGNRSVYESLFSLVDGFILTGGQDITPERYGAHAEGEEAGKLSELTPEREEVECLILSYAYRFDLPVLGICRGMQMMNVYFGGTLYLDLADQFSGKEPMRPDACAAGCPQAATCPIVGHWQRCDYAEPTHFVRIVRASRLGHILSRDKLPTNSMHHQGVRDVASLLDPVAYGPDGLVEAVEVRDRSFMLGAQWHPEFFAGSKSMGCLFKTLALEAEKAHARGRAGVRGTLS